MINNYHETVKWCMKQFEAMGATEAQLKLEYFKMMADPDYLIYCMDLLDFEESNLKAS